MVEVVEQLKLSPYIPGLFPVESPEVLSLIFRNALFGSFKNI